MAFTSVVLKRGVIGDMNYVTGTFTNTAGSTGGDIVHGLKRLQSAFLQHTGSSVVASAPVINETFPTSANLTIVTVADADGVFIIYGE